MKKNELIVLTLFTLVILFGCSNIDEGKSGICKSIIESKNRNVFLIEKKVRNEIDLNNLGREIKVDEFWFEKMWIKGKLAGEIEKDKVRYQFSANLALTHIEISSDSVFVIYNNDFKNELSIFNSRIYSFASLKLNEIPDSIVLDFYRRSGIEQKKIKTVILN